MPLPDFPEAGITVIESPPGEAPIPLHRDTVTAFVGPAPRGPAHIPVAIGSVAEFRKRFGSPAERSRMEWILGQFFDNGGETAIVVRVPRTGGVSRLALAGPGGTLDLLALNPGPLEYLRAAVDYDGVSRDDLWRFNLVVQRVRSPANPLVEEQEIWPGLSIAPDEQDYVGDALSMSRLVRLDGEPPRGRPYITPGAVGLGPVGYAWATAAPRRGEPPSDYDLIGSVEDSTGIHALDQVPRVDLICLLSGTPTTDVGPVGLFAAERYCARRNALLLLDPPAAWTRVDEVAASALDAAFASPNVITYFPRLAAASPDGRPRATLSALGAIAGMLSTGGQDRSAADEPALLRSRARVVIEAGEAEAVLLARRGVNALRPAAPGFLSFNGDVTLARRRGNRPEWQQLSIRRRAITTADTIARSTRWVTLQAPGAATWQAVTEQVRRYLGEARDAGLLAGDREGRAFYVKCDEETNPRDDGVSFIVGLALVKPGDFVAFRFDHRLAACRVSEVSWQPPPSSADVAADRT